MARPKQFDPDEALTKAMEVFWINGFDATSIEELVRATGVNRHSLYEHFGDKERLFELALERYDGIFFELFLQDLADPAAGVDAIHTCLDNLQHRLLMPEAVRGCFMLNSSGDIGSRNPEIARRIRLRLSQFERRLVATLKAAQTSKQISKHLDVHDCARFVNALIQGTTTLRKATGSAATVRSAIAIAHATIDSWRSEDA
jgi:TetR/AcrR family transcriptional repressor of nem operon